MIRQNASTHTSDRLRILTCIAVALACATFVSAGPYADGEMIEITGTVTDSNGVPIRDLSVVFRASRRAFTVSKLSRATRDEVEMHAVTDAEGQFSFDWRWLDYYNRFELEAGVPTRSAAGETFEVLADLDMGERIQQGSPVVASLIVDDTAFLTSLRDFLDSIDTEDEKRIYNEMGNPDRVQETEYGDGTEISWWYFQLGKAYRFREGSLDQIVDFDPITPFAPTAND